MYQYKFRLDIVVQPGASVVVRHTSYRFFIPFALLLYFTSYFRRSWLDIGVQVRTVLVKSSREGVTSSILSRYIIDLLFFIIKFFCVLYLFIIIV